MVKLIKMKTSKKIVKAPKMTKYEKIISLRQKGLTYKQIAAKVGLTMSGVSYHLSK